MRGQNPLVIYIYRDIIMAQNYLWRSQQV
jgi:hypothetical protein